MWQCPMCSCCNLHGMLLRTCCESICLFQKEGDPCAFTPIGRQALVTSTTTAQFLIPPDASGPEGAQRFDNLADPSVSCDTDGKHEYTKWSSLKDTVGRCSDGVLRHFPLSPTLVKGIGSRADRARHRHRSRKRSASVACSDPDQSGEESLAHEALGAHLSPERRASRKRKGATRGVSCDTDLGEIPEYD